METRFFSNGDAIPAIGLGTWKAAKGEVYLAVRKAIEIGYRHFDCAYVYGNEAEIGLALVDAIKNGEVKRSELFLTSKLWNNSHNPEDVLSAAKNTISDLKCEYLDLYLIHWPVVHKKEVLYPENGDQLISLNDLPLEKTWEAMQKLLEKDMVRHLGVSNFSISKIKQVWESVGLKPEMNQVECHLYLQQKELFHFCTEENILFTGYCPLGSADRPASRKLENEPKLFEDLYIQLLAEEKNCSAAQVMLGWAVQRGGIVIPKSTHEGRLKENLFSFQIKFSHKEMEKLTELDKRYRYINGSFWCLEGSDYTYEKLWS